MIPPLECACEELRSIADAVTPSLADLSLVRLALAGLWSASLRTVFPTESTRDPRPASTEFESTDADDRLVTDGGWESVESPTSRTLHGVVHTADGPYACGEDGMLLRRNDGWEIVLERGPGVAANTLRSIDATDDGGRVWFAGDSGALGIYDVTEDSVGNYSAPMEKTSTWEAIAVTDPAGEEGLRIANGSGEVLDVTCEDGCPVLGDVVEPGDGSTIPDVAAGGDDFYAIDTSGGVYRSDGEWERIGVRNAEVDFYDLWAGEETVLVAGADGIAYQYDPKCLNWTPLHVGEGALQAISADGPEPVAAATEGRIYEQTTGVRWEPVETETEQSLTDLAVAVEDSAGAAVDVAVGSSGTILERPTSFD